MNKCLLSALTVFSSVRVVILLVFRGTMFVAELASCVAFPGLDSDGDHIAAVCRGCQLHGLAGVRASRRTLLAGSGWRRRRVISSCWAASRDSASARKPVSSVMVASWRASRCLSVASSFFSRRSERPGGRRLPAA